MSRIVHPAGWISKPFSKAATRIQTRGGNLKTKEYQESGCLPIVDQGQNLVVAYTGKRNCLFQGPYPVIVFGDHTKNVKLVNFEFAVGADGVVLLRPADENEIDIRFLYYWLKYVPLHNLGYSRHFKLLKEQNITYPVNLNEQRRIVARIEELTRRAEEARRLRQQAVEKVSTVMHAVIQSILSNRVDFVQTPIGNICSMKTGKTPPTKQIEYFDGDVLFVCPSDLGKSLKISKSERHLTKKAVADGKANLFKTGTVLLVGIGSTVGKVGIAKCDLCTNQQITGLFFNDSVLPEYAVWYLLTQRDVIRNAAAGGGVPILNQQGISQLVIWHPNSIDAQRAIVRKLDALQEKLDELTAEQNSVDEDLAAFQPALLAKAFRGEL